MSTLYYTSADGLLNWLKKLAGERRFVAPRQEGPSVVFRALKAEALTDLNALLRRATSSPKEAVLPKSEILLRFSAVKDPSDPGRLDMTLEAPDGARDSGPTVLFGGRPCDARGFVTLDRPYLQGTYSDPYYRARREATLIITQACPSSSAACFCHWVGSHPADGEGSDVLFSALDGGFALEAFSGKGQALLDESAFEKADARRSALDAARQAVAAALPPPPPLENVAEKVAALFRDEAFWAKHTAQCLSCGACTYLCPTCQCFSISDEGNALDGRRIRSWDSCMTSQFTLEASGHNPRGDKAKRMRQRLSHKFSYYPAHYGGSYSCCGCGRCLLSCPVSLDIRQLLTAALDAAPALTAEPAVTAKAAPAAAKAKARPSAKTAKKTSAKE